MRRHAASIAIGVALLVPGPSAAAPAASRVNQAIVEAIQARMGADAMVIVSELEILNQRDFAFVEAVPEPAARVGDRIHFRLVGSDGSGAGVRAAGTATARVRVEVEHVRALALVTRGKPLASGEVEASRAGLPALPLRRLPRLAEVTGSLVLENLAPGEVLTRTSVAARPAVKSGQIVRATARVGSVAVTATLVAAQDGAPGAVIRVVNKASRRELRARVVGPGVVEVIQ